MSEAFSGRCVKRIACVIHSLAAGGAERMLTTMVNHWADAGFDVHVVTFSGAMQPAFDLHHSVKVHFLDVAGASSGLWSAVAENLNRVKAVRRMLRDVEPDVVLGFMDTTNVITILASAGLDFRVVATEHTDPRKHVVGGMWRALRLVAYLFADAITVQTRQARNYFPKAIQKKITILPNPVEMPPSQCGRPLNLPKGPFVIAIGRLSKEKGFARLIRAFSCIADKHPQWSLVILGEGEERRVLESLRDSRGLVQRVQLPGFTQKPYEWLHYAALFVLSSEFEGFGNVTLEALMCGVPAVAVDCSGIANKIIQNRINGLLVSCDDDKSLAEGMDILMSDLALLQSMSEHAPESVREYSLPTVMKKWNETLLLKM